MAYLKFYNLIGKDSAIKSKIPNYYLAHLQITYVYHKIMDNPLKIEEAFKDYLSEHKLKSVDLLGIRKWMVDASCGQLTYVVSRVN